MGFVIVSLPSWQDVTSQTPNHFKKLDKQAQELLKNTQLGICRAKETANQDTKPHI